MAYLFQDSNYKKNLQLLYLVFISKYKRESLANTKKDRFRNGVLKSEEVPTFRVLTVKQVWFLAAFSRTVENTVWYSDFYGFIVHWLIPKFEWLKAGLETMSMAFAKVVEHFSFHYFTYPILAFEPKISQLISWTGWIRQMSWKSLLRIFWLSLRRPFDFSTSNYFWKDGKLNMFRSSSIL